MNRQDLDAMTLDELNILLGQAEGMARKDQGANAALVPLREAIQRKHDRMSPEEIEDKEAGGLNNDNIPSTQPGEQNPY